MSKPIAHIAEDGREHNLYEQEGTVPDLRTEQSEVVESGLSPLKRCVADFAAEFGSGEWAYLAGLWHEVGKNIR